jgi:hypothetical protein
VNSAAIFRPQRGRVQWKNMLRIAFVVLASGVAALSWGAVGDIRFNGRDRAHTELLIRGIQHAVITELK